jgi:hypothetical protein
MTQEGIKKRKVENKIKKENQFTDFMIDIFDILLICFTLIIMYT